MTTASCEQGSGSFSAMKGWETREITCILSLQPFLGEQSALTPPPSRNELSLHQDVHGTSPEAQWLSNKFSPSALFSELLLVHFNPLSRSWESFGFREKAACPKIR